tara:strand:- start:261 stop:398 length:138 start_codon:yes stop_codon:yes gene_type:complete
MRQFKPIKNHLKKSVKQKAIKATQLERFNEESRKPRIKRNGALIG